MAKPSAFWFLLTGLLIVAPLPASAASSWASAGASVGFGADPKKCAVLEATSATCDVTNSAPDPNNSGETKSGTVDVAADLRSGDLFVRAESAASQPTAETAGEAQIADTLSFGGAISQSSVTTLTMSGA